MGIVVWHSREIKNIVRRDKMFWLCLLLFPFALLGEILKQSKWIEYITGQPRTACAGAFLCGGCGCISPGSLAPLWAVLWACVGWVWVSLYTSTTAADCPPFFFCPGVCCPGCAVFGVYLFNSGASCSAFIIVRRSCPGNDTPGNDTPGGGTLPPLLSRGSASSSPKFEKDFLDTNKCWHD